MDILGNSLGAVLFLLLLMMVIMVLIPRVLATLQLLRIKAPDQEIVSLPSATLGEPYEIQFASEGGEEFVTFDLVEGEKPPGLDWMKATHGDAGRTTEDPDYETQFGLSGVPTGDARDYTFVLRARSALPLDQKRRAELLKPENRGYIESPPKKFRIRVLEPAVKRLDDVEDLSIVSVAELPATRLTEDGKATVQITAKGGVVPYDWSVEPLSGVDNQHLEISPDGWVTVAARQPTELGFRVVVSSANAGFLSQKGKPVTATQTFTWRLLPPASTLRIITPTDLPSAVAGARYEVALAARGGTGVYKWLTAPEGTTDCPDWLTVDAQASARLVADIPAKGYRKDPYAFRVQVTDGAPGQKPVTKDMRLRVNPPALVTADPADPASNVRITTDENLPAATANLPYSLTFAAEGGRAPYHWALEQLEFRPPATSSFVKVEGKGVVLGDDGLVNLRPKQPGEAKLTIRVWDSGLDGGKGTRTDQKSVSLTIKPPPGAVTQPLRIVTPPDLPDATARKDYQIAFSAVGGLAPYQWSLEGKPPATFNFEKPAEGIITGKPDDNSVGTHKFVVVVTDQQGPEAAQKVKLTLNVRPGIKPLRLVTTKLPAAGLNQLYEAPLMAEGGLPPYRWTVLADSFPTGLELDGNSGLVTGTPTQVTDESILLTVEVSAADGARATGDVSLAVLPVIEPQPLQILTPKTLPPAIVGQRYEMQLAAIGGVPPYHWQRGDPWPDRNAGTVKLSPDGNLSNPVFPTKKTHVLQAKVRDALGTEASGEFRLEVYEEGEIPAPLPPLEIVTPASLPDATVGQEYRLALAAEGGRAPLEWTLQEEVPQGMSVENGVIVWTPTNQAEGSNGFAVSVRDSQDPADGATKEVTLYVGKPDTHPPVPPINSPKWLWLAGIFLASAVIKQMWKKFCLSHIEIS